MKKAILTAILLLGAISAFAQDQKFSATVAFPLAVGDFEYTGLASIGVQYRFVKVGPVAIGASAAIDFLNNRDELGSTTVKSNTFLIQPRILGELNIPAVQKLKPFIGLGYTWANFKTEYDTFDEKRKKGGLNFNLGAAYDISDSFFVHLQFDSTRLVYETRGLINDPFFSSPSKSVFSLNLIKIGAGLRF